MGATTNSPLVVRHDPQLIEALLGTGHSEPAGNVNQADQRYELPAGAGGVALDADLEVGSK
ncbi:MAG: hypothetical protein M3N32_02980 [Actinomycetota bacterium]|nr:hypothetical protein [Actinomycetota bacterium]